METRKLLDIGLRVKNKKSNFIIYLGIVLLAVVSRLLPHPPNFTPIGSLALFSGATLLGWPSLLIPLVSMFVSDIFLGFHPTMPYVYISFIFATIIGKFFLKKISSLKIIAVSLAASFLFFLITNFGVWLNTNMYTKDLAGLIQSYVMGIPFFRNTLFGDMFYSFSLFYGYDLLISLFRRIQTVKVTNKGK